MRHLVHVILKQVDSLKLQIVYRDICKTKTVAYRHVIISDKTLS